MNRPQKPALSLLVLATAIFIFIVSEIFPIGLLPEISKDLGVSNRQTGLLLTYYAIVAGLTAFPLTVSVGRIERKRLLVIVMALFVASQFLAAIAPNYWALVGARVLCALGHGVFWAVITPVAAEVFEPGQEGRATAAVFSGSAAALIMGLPLVTLLGQALSWRAASALIGLVGLLVLLAMMVMLPRVAGRVDSRMSPAMLSHLVSKPLMGLYAMTIVITVGQFISASYTAPMAEQLAGITGTGYGVLLFVYGIATLISLVVFGRLLDAHLRVLLGTSLALIAAALTFIGLVHSRTVFVVAFIVWGAAFTLVPSALQTFVLRVSGKFSDVASAIYVVAFQIGISSGAAIGGLLLSGHLRWAPLATASFACAALVALTTYGWSRSRLARLD